MVQGLIPAHDTLARMMLWSGVRVPSMALFNNPLDHHKIQNCYSTEGLGVVINSLTYVLHSLLQTYWHGP